MPDAPKIVFPGRPSLVEDSTLTIYGMEVYDADVSRPGNERILFNIWLEVTSGRLSLNGSMVRISEYVVTCCIESPHVFQYFA